MVDSHWAIEEDLLVNVDCDCGQDVVHVCCVCVCVVRSSWWGSTSLKTSHGVLVAGRNMSLSGQVTSSRSPSSATSQKGTIDPVWFCLAFLDCLMCLKCRLHWDNPVLPVLSQSVCEGFKILPEKLLMFWKEFIWLGVYYIIYFIKDLIHLNLCQAIFPVKVHSWITEQPLFVSKMIIRKGEAWPKKENMFKELLQHQFNEELIQTSQYQ